MELDAVVDSFADDIVLYAPTRRKLSLLLEEVSKWANNNLMTFGINKCATMVIRPLHVLDRSPYPVFFFYY